MKLSSLRRSRTTDAALTGTARVDRRTRNLVRRLSPGDIAVIDHVDLDRAAAVALVEAGVSAVVNAAPSVSGRYPNLGPRVLLDAGVALIDHVGSDAFAAIDDGERHWIVGDIVYSGEAAVACGVRQDTASIEAALEASKEGLPSQLEAFSASTVEHLRRDRGPLVDGTGVPVLATQLRERHVVVVHRAFDYSADLARLRPYIADQHPVLVGVEAGADVMLQAGYRPDIVVTIGDDISDAALTCGAEIVELSSTESKSGSLADRFERLGISPVDFCVSVSAEDAAVLLAAAGDASLIVVAGSHSSLLEFLDRGQSAMASSVLTRAAVGSRLVDARAVAALYRHRIRGWWVLLLALVSLLCVAAAVATTPVGHDWLDAVWTWVTGEYARLRDTLP